MTAPTRRKSRRGRPPGKHSDPDYVQVGAYLQRRTYEAVKQRLAERPGKDFSGLVDQLLVDWLDSTAYKSLSAPVFARKLADEIAGQRWAIEASRRGEGPLAGNNQWVPESTVKARYMHLLDQAEMQLGKASRSLPECASLYRQFVRQRKQAKVAPPKGCSWDPELTCTVDMKQVLDWLQAELSKLAGLRVISA